MSPVNYTDLSMDDLFSQHVEQQDIESLPEPSQAGPFLAHPTGGYRIKVDTLEIKKLADDDRYNPGRVMGHAQASISTKSGEPLRGKVFFDVSHVQKVNANNPTTKDGKPNWDRPYKLFLQAAKALGVEKEPIPTIYEAIEKYPMDAFLTEDFYQKGVQGSYKKNGTPTDIELWRGQAQKGELATKNTVQSISKIKE